MAIMIPDDIEAFNTEGEKQFYKFLKDAAKPDSRFISWYLPDIKEKEPDFLLFCDEVGLVVFEVKDWSLNQIMEANPHHFKLEIGNKTESRKNPLKQARDYLLSVIEMIKKDGRLVSEVPDHYGNPKIPINCCVVFPNINKYEYTQKDFDDVIQTDKIFFWDDLHPLSDFYSDKTGRHFLDTLKKMFAPRFRFQITGRELNHLRFTV